MAKLIKCKGCGAEIYKNAKVCPNCGKKNKKHKGLIILIIIVILIIVTAISSKYKDDKEKKVTYTWPTSGVATLLPKPDAEYGKIGIEAEDYFTIDLYFVSESDYNDYVNKCKDAGFTVDYNSIGSSYDADDESGNSLSLSYDADDEEMSISLYAYEEPDTETEEEPEEETQTKESKSKKKEDKSSDEDSDFRDWVDSYEEVMNEYCDFMEDYDPSDISQLSEYTDLMTKYSEFLEETDELDEDDYSTSDWAYYLEANARVMKRLAEIQ